MTASVRSRRTARRSRDSTLRATLAEHQVIFDNALVGIVYLCDRGIVRCNRRFEEMFDYAPASLTGRSIMVLYPTPEEYERKGRQGYAYLQTHLTYSDERQMRRRNGELFWCRVSGRVLDPERPAHLGVWIFQDISQQKQAEEALQKANERLEQRVQERTTELRRALEALREEIAGRKRLEERERAQRAELSRVSRLNTMGEMAAALAHELGQPLASALNYLHGCQLRLASGEAPDSELLASALSQATFHADRAGGIVRNVRRFVRRHEPESVPVALDALIRQTAEFLDFERRESGAEVQLRLAPQLPPVLADPLEIQQVVVNLMKNAFEAMADQPTPRRVLELSTRQRGLHIEVAVADRGPGIARKDLTRIFEPFYTTKPKGTGLGLAVCRTIVESHGGRLTVGRNVENGATFTFTLPVLRDE